MALSRPDGDDRLPAPELPDAPSAPSSSSSSPRFRSIVAPSMPDPPSTPPSSLSSPRSTSALGSRSTTPSRTPRLTPNSSAHASTQCEASHGSRARLSNRPASLYVQGLLEESSALRFSTELSESLPKGVLQSSPHIPQYYTLASPRALRPTLPALTPLDLPKAPCALSSSTGSPQGSLEGSPQSSTRPRRYYSLASPRPPRPSRPSSLPHAAQTARPPGLSPRFLPQRPLQPEAPSLPLTPSGTHLTTPRQGARRTSCVQADLGFTTGEPQAGMQRSLPRYQSPPPQHTRPQEPRLKAFCAVPVPPSSSGAPLGSPSSLGTQYPGTASGVLLPLGLTGDSTALRSQRSREPRSAGRVRARATAEIVQPPWPPPIPDMPLPVDPPAEPPTGPPTEPWAEPSVGPLGEPPAAAPESFLASPRPRL